MTIWLTIALILLLLTALLRHWKERFYAEVDAVDIPQAYYTEFGPEVACCERCRLVRTVNDLPREFPVFELDEEL